MLDKSAPEGAMGTGTSCQGSWEVLFTMHQEIGRQDSVPARHPAGVMIFKTLKNIDFNNH